MGEMEKDRSIIAMGAWLEVLSEEKDGNRLARHHRHGKIWKKPTRHEDIAFRQPHTQQHDDYAAQRH
ncbi:putative lacto-N-neotetraose biosynthesis glycosyl transferase LgtA [Neisseria meningitidis 61103]|nr:putative lacto-N-neotetraose biosynthesis glycosyl transferase LgtA [Neisseria meningitidis 61103]